MELVRPIEGAIAAFYSAQIIHMIAARWLGLPPLAAKYFYTATAVVGILRYEHNQDQAVVLLWDGTSACGISRAVDAESA